MIAACSVGFCAGLLVWTLLDFLAKRALDLKIGRALRLQGKAAASFFPRLTRRKNAQALPDFLDLLALGLSAGHTLERAWSMAVRYLPESAFRGELKRVESGWAMGRPRRETFDELCRSLHDPSLALVFKLIEQSLARGGELQSVLRSQAHALRKLQFLEVEKRAQTAGLRMLLPIFVFIFPTVFLILFAPLLIRLSQGVSLF